MEIKGHVLITIDTTCCICVSVGIHKLPMSLPNTASSILIKPNEHYHCGVEAKQKYEGLKSEWDADWSFFQDPFGAINHCNNMDGLTIRDHAGKEMPAKTVFPLAIRYLKEQSLQQIRHSGGIEVSQNDLVWEFTLPPDWRDIAVQTFKKAVSQTGIPVRLFSVEGKEINTSSWAHKESCWEELANEFLLCLSPLVNNLLLPKLDEFQHEHANDTRNIPANSSDQNQSFRLILDAVRKSLNQKDYSDHACDMYSIRKCKKYVEDGTYPPTADDCQHTCFPDASEPSTNIFSNDSFHLFETAMDQNPGVGHNSITSCWFEESPKIMARLDLKENASDDTYSSVEIEESQETYSTDTEVQFDEAEREFCIGIGSETDIECDADPYDEISDCDSETCDNDIPYTILQIPAMNIPNREEDSLITLKEIPQPNYPESVTKKGNIPTIVSWDLIEIDKPQVYEQLKLPMPLEVSGYEQYSRQEEIKSDLTTVAEKLQEQSEDETCITLDTVEEKDSDNKEKGVNEAEIKGELQTAIDFVDSKKSVSFQIITVCHGTEGLDELKKSKEVVDKFEKKINIWNQKGGSEDLKIMLRNTSVKREIYSELIWKDDVKHLKEKAVNVFKEPYLERGLRVFGTSNIDDSFRMLYQVISALLFLEKQGYRPKEEMDTVVHLDLKPGNIVLDCNRNAKLIDFGLAREMNETDTRLHLPELKGPKFYLDWWIEPVENSTLKNGFSKLVGKFDVGANVLKAGHSKLVDGLVAGKDFLIWLIKKEGSLSLPRECVYLFGVQHEWNELVVHVVMSGGEKTYEQFKCFLKQTNQDTLLQYLTQLEDRFYRKRYDKYLKKTTDDSTFIKRTLTEVQNTWVRFEGEPLTEVQQTLKGRQLALLSTGRLQNYGDSGDNPGPQDVQKGQLRPEEVTSCPKTSVICVLITLLVSCLISPCSSSKIPVKRNTFRTIIFLSLLCFSQAGYAWYPGQNDGNNSRHLVEPFDGALVHISKAWDLVEEIKGERNGISELDIFNELVDYDELLFGEFRDGWLPFKIQGEMHIKQYDNANEGFEVQCGGENILLEKFTKLGFDVGQTYWTEIRVCISDPLQNTTKYQRTNAKNVFPENTHLQCFTQIMDLPIMQRCKDETTCFSNCTHSKKSFTGVFEITKLYEEVFTELIFFVLTVMTATLFFCCMIYEQSYVAPVSTSGVAGVILLCVMITIYVWITLRVKKENTDTCDQVVVGDNRLHSDAWKMLLFLIVLGVGLLCVPVKVLLLLCTMYAGIRKYFFVKSTSLIAIQETCDNVLDVTLQSEHGEAERSEHHSSCHSCEAEKASHSEKTENEWDDYICLQGKGKNITHKDIEKERHFQQTEHYTAEVYKSEDTVPSDFEPLEAAAADDVYIHDSVATKAYMPSKDEEIIFENAIENATDVDFGSFEEEETPQKKYENDSTHDDFMRQNNRERLRTKHGNGETGDDFVGCGDENETIDVGSARFEENKYITDVDFVEFENETAAVDFVRFEENEDNTDVDFGGFENGTTAVDLDRFEENKDYTDVDFGGFKNETIGVEFEEKRENCSDQNDFIKQGIRDDTNVTHINILAHSNSEAKQIKSNIDKGAQDRNSHYPSRSRRKGSYEAKTSDTFYIAEIENSNGNDDLNITIPPPFGSSLPLAENDEIPEKSKLRLKVIPSPSQKIRQQSAVEAVAKKVAPLSCKRQQSFKAFKNLKYKAEVERSRKENTDCTFTEDEFETLLAIRACTWLPLNELPVPEIKITVAFFPKFEPLLSIIEQIANGTPPTPHVSMRYELLRFCTLRSYPKENKPYLIKLAEAGFYYASDGDGVVCYCCGVRRYNWVAEDMPMKIHERINPNCKFLRKNEEVNVPVQYFGPFSRALMAIMDIPEPRERSEQSEDVNNDWAPERIRSPAPAQQNRQVETGANSLGINTAIPKHTQYATKTAREGSYSGWPDTASHTPQELAEAGFFYAGFGDCVRCFYCGIGLRHWTKDDNPWIEHARWSRNCVFVKQKKGEEFVNLVQLAVQYSQDNEAQSNSSAGNQLPVQEIERILLSDAAQSVLEMGYQPRIIKKAIEQILRQDGNAKITAQILMEKVLEIEEAENPPQAAPAPTQVPVATVAAPPQAKPTSQPAKTEGAVNKEGSQAAAKPKAEKKPDEGATSSLQSKDNDKDKDKKETKTNSESKELSAEAISQDPKAIKAENEQLKEQTLCKVCLDNTVCIVFLPCGHLVTCADCAPAMRKCPICRALVKGTVRTYMS